MIYRLKIAASRGCRRVYADSWTAAGKTSRWRRPPHQREIELDSPGTFFCAVCDGVGEYDGQSASQTVITAMNAWWDSLAADDRECSTMEALAYGLVEAGAAALGGRSIYTTLSLAVIRGVEVYTLNLGDSPIFLGRELSARHNHFYMNQKEGRPTCPHQKNELVYSVRDGMDCAHTDRAELAPGTPLLLCSDGIEPEAILCSEFFGAVRNAADQPGADNVTAIMVELV